MVEESFERFWNCYPKKVGKFYARQCWRRVKGDSLIEEILASIENWKANPQWNDPQFIPNPSTFLNQHRWEDEVPVARRERRSEVDRELNVGGGTHQELYELALAVEARNKRAGVR
jgi:hypothetical protein